MTSDEESKGVTFGIYGPGRASLGWARHLESLGPDFWYYSPNGNEMVSVLDLAPRADIQTDAPYLSDSYTDVIIFTGPANRERTNLMIQAMEAGTSVICEPPLARSYEDIRLLHDTAEEVEVCLITAHRVIHTHSWNQISHWVDNRIGKAHSIFVNWHEVDSGMDPLWDILPDAIAAIGAMFDEPVIELEAQHGPGWIRVGLADEEGREYHITAMSGAPFPEHNITVLGTRGSVHAEPFQEEAYLKNGKQITLDRNWQGGVHRSLLLLMCQRMKEYSDFGKEQIYGEVGSGVTDILLGIESFLEEASHVS